MEKYNLQPNESIIFKNECVRHRDTNGELLLTNLNLVYITTKGIFKTTYIHKLYPVNQIRTLNGKVQVILGENGKMDVQFLHGIESFRFWNGDTFFSEKKAEKEAIRWMNGIEQLIKGQVCEINTPVSGRLAEVDIIAETIKDTFDIFKSNIISTKKVETKNINSVKKCIYCGAQVSGVKGQVTCCEYCDGEQEI